MAALPSKPGCLSDEQKALPVAAKQESPEAFAVFLNATIPREAPYGFRPDWNSCHASVFKRVGNHNQVDNNIRQQTGMTYTAMVCKLSCGKGFEE